MKLQFRQRSVLPGFGLTMGFTLVYLSLIVLIPLAGLFLNCATMSWPDFWQTVTDPRAVASYRLSFGASALAATINTAFGFVVAWVLVRYRFPGRRLLDAMVDLPFALPTAVSGIALTALYVPTGWIGRLLAPLGIQVAYTWLGVVVALTFIGMPFVVRTLQPALEDLEPELEEAAASLGASRLQTFRRVLLPPMLPVVLTGFAMAFARALGEYGSVIFISANLRMKTEIAPFLIYVKLEQYRITEATAIALVVLVASFAILLAINLLQRWSRRWHTEGA
jgi:sulfate/thiosulfate transport system permease protein